MLCCLSLLDIVKQKTEKGWPYAYKSQITMQSHQLKNIFTLHWIFPYKCDNIPCRIIAGQIGITATCHKLFSTQFNPFSSMNKLPLNITTCSHTLSHGKICQYTPVISFLARHPSHYITKKNSAWKELWHAQCVSIPNWKVAFQTSITQPVEICTYTSHTSRFFWILSRWK